ncbi:AIPR family protein [Fischerella sp. PCC 9605]|uniref:AIPR family protein n=1 Tax=Fischerella sp. PCC 9605 TaxID=1173024 RepID=UPI0004B5152C|nr:AIPR family protein [Fischerella sp. PCC 9605]
MKHATSKRSVDFVEFPYYSFRNVSCPEDIENNRKTLFGHAPLTSVLSLPTNENVRDYLLDAEGKQRRRPTSVHRAIEDTLKNSSHKFSVLNGGLVIVSRDYTVDEQKKCLFLVKPSIINGSQTQGVIKDFFNDCQKFGGEIPEIHVTFELIITTDDDLIAEISIARNFQNDVMSLSIAGRLGQLDELEASLQAKLSGKKLRKSETQLSDDYLATERLLQVIAALVPGELWLNEKEVENPNKVYTYDKKAKCLKDFREIYSIAKGEKQPEKKIDSAKYKELYQFYLDVAAQAYQLYEKWKKHQGFKGTGLKKGITRDENQNILEVSDGIIFPILASLSAFARKTPEGWKIEPPDSFRDEELIRMTKSVFMEMADSNPATMGKSKACYAALYQITSLYKRLSI